jgi:hypothetical protein
LSFRFDRFWYMMEFERAMEPADLTLLMKDISSAVSWLRFNFSPRKRSPMTALFWISGTI